MQFPSRWATVSAVVSKGPNPLPAALRFKADAVDPNQFWIVSKENWDKVTPEDMKTPVYEGLQYRLRWLISRAIIRTFAQIEYTLDINNKYLPRFPKHFEEMVEVITGEIDDELEELCQSQDDPFRNLIEDQITTGYLAELCVDLTHSFRANKNWNWHGAMMGATLGSLASLLAFVDKDPPGLPRNFGQKIPKGVLLTGAKHGHHGTHYVEYMLAASIKDPLTERVESYLSETKFTQKGHAKKVLDIFNQTTEHFVGKNKESRYNPTARPTRAHTVDFAVMYKGVYLLDGECKDKAVGSDVAVIVMHSLEQLAYRDEAIAVMTSSTQISLYVSKKNETRKTIKTLYVDFPEYKLGGLPDLSQDDDDEATTIAAIPEIPTKLDIFPNKTGEGDAPNVASARNICSIPEIKDSDIDVKWKNMRKEVRRYIVSVMSCMDVLVEKLAHIDLDDIREKKQASYDRGLVEPKFLSTEESTLERTGRVVEGDWWYSPRNMGDNEMLSRVVHPVQQVQPVQPAVQPNPELPSVLKNNTPRETAMDVGVSNVANVQSKGQVAAFLQQVGVEEVVQQMVLALTNRSNNDK